MCRGRPRLRRQPRPSAEREDRCRRTDSQARRKEALYSSWFAVGARPTRMHLSSRSRKATISPITWPSGETGTRFLARLVSRLAKLLTASCPRSPFACAFDDQFVLYGAGREARRSRATPDALRASSKTRAATTGYTWMPTLQLRSLSTMPPFSSITACGLWLLSARPSSPRRGNRNPRPIHRPIAVRRHTAASAALQQTARTPRRGHRSGPVSEN